ncbi:hypothetical protein RYX36_030952 [Vicia faba]
MGAKGVSAEQSTTLPVQIFFSHYKKKGKHDVKEEQCVLEIIRVTCDCWSYSQTPSLPRSKLNTSRISSAAVQNLHQPPHSLQSQLTVHGNVAAKLSSFIFSNRCNLTVLPSTFSDSYYFALHPKLCRAEYRLHGGKG